MTNGKSNKRALFGSVTALVLCFSMLIGTTFAWFTDSASSGKNTITAGNLDIELEYLKDGEWASVQDQTDLVDPNALWEPGRTEVVYLRVRNVGSLALKYKFAVNKYSETIGVNAEGGAIKLSEILKFGIVRSEQAQNFNDRESAKAAIVGNEFALNTYCNDIRLGANETKYYTLVIYMPEETGNEANYETGSTPPSIELGIDLVATQDTFENDGFGYDYDQNSGSAAGYTVTVVVPVETVAKALNTWITTVADAEDALSATETVAEEKTVEAGGIKVTYPVDTLLDTLPEPAEEAGVVASTQDARQGLTYKEAASAFGITASGEDEKVSVYELTLPVSQSNTTLLKVTAKLPADFTMVNIYHDGVAMARAESADAVPAGEAYYYNSATGQLVLWVYHASEIAMITKSEAPIQSMFPTVNATILSTVIEDEDTVMRDDTSGTTAIIPANAVEAGIVQPGQRVYLVIQTTTGDDNSITYDISIRDADGSPFGWTMECMPEVTFFLGTAEDLFGFNLNCFELGYAKIYDRVGAAQYPESVYGNQYFDGTGDEYGQMKYGDQYAPGMTYDPDTGFITMRSITFA